MTQRTLTEWIKLLEPLALPSCGGSGDELRRLCSNENTPLPHIAHLIETDLGLSLHLMRQLNAMKHRHLGSEVNTIAHAVMMLGIRQLKLAPQRVPDAKSLSATQQARLHACYSQAYHAAHQARELARLRKEMEPDELFIAAYLHHIGEIFLWLHAPQQMERIEELIHDDQMEPQEAQYVVLGFGIDQLTLELARRWQLPTIVLDSLHAENASRPRILGIMLAVQLARIAQHGWYRHETTTLIKELAEFMLFDFGETVSFLHRHAVEAGQLTPHLSTLSAAAILLYPSRPEAAPDYVPPKRVKQPPVQNSAATTPPSAAKASAAKQQDDTETHDSDFCIAGQPRLLPHIMMRLADQQSTPTMQSIISLTLRGMHDALGLNRVVFATLTPDKGQLVARTIVGSDNSPHFNRFAIDVEQGNLFDQLLQKPQALWLDEKNGSKFLPLVPRKFLDIVTVRHFYVMSLFVKNKTVGLVYADRHNETCGLDARSYHHFKQLATQASKSLERVIQVR